MAQLTAARTVSITDEEIKRLPDFRSFREKVWVRACRRRVGRAAERPSGSHPVLSRVSCPDPGPNPGPDPDPLALTLTLTLTLTLILARDPLPLDRGPSARADA